MKIKNTQEQQVKYIQAIISISQVNKENMGSCQNEATVLNQLGTQSNQGHLMNHWKNLPSNDKRRTFQQQLNQINLAKTVSLYKRKSTLTQLTNSISTDKTHGGISVYKPLPQELIIHKSDIASQKAELDSIGLQAIQNGEVAVFLMSGSQNPSLNIGFPIGMYDLGTDSASQIFEIMIYKLARLNIMTGGFDNKKIKVYIMTSTQNKNEIKNYFKNKNYFNYGANNVFFFSQSSEPVVDDEGKIMLKTESQIYTSPRGNGAIYTEIKDKNLLQHLRSQGIKYTFFGPINNILMKIASPTTLGYLIRQSQQVVATAVECSDDCFGYFGLAQNGKSIIVNEEVKSHPNKKWAFTGSCYMNIQFLNSVICNEMFMQRIKNEFKPLIKQALVFNLNTNTGAKTKCVFFENFYHEAFELASKIKIMEVEINSEFAPIRNNDQGKYSITYARNALWNWHRGLLQNAGISFVGEGHVEIHPRLIYDGENIQKVVKQKQIKSTIKLPQFIK